MKVDAIDGDNPKVSIELGETEADHLLVFLLHAKFSEDVRLEVVGSPTMQQLLRGLLEAQKKLGFDEAAIPGWTVIEEGDGLHAPPSFSMIEKELQRSLGRDDVGSELVDHLFPYTWVRKHDH